MSKNLYDILEINVNASQEEIKFAYRKLATKFHPDNNKNENNDIINERFIDIKNAYDILSDEQKRKKYDDLNNPEKDEFYDDLKDFVKKNVMSDIDKYINFFFGEDNTFKIMLKRMDIGGICNQIMNKASCMSSNELTDILGIPDRYNSFLKNQENSEVQLNESINESINEFNNESDQNKDENIIYDTLNSNLLKNDIKNKTDDNNLNISGTLYTTLYDKYNNKYRKIKIKRKTKNDILLFVPLRMSQYVVEGEGEYDNINKINGNIILGINLMDDENVYHLGVHVYNNDIYKHVYISLHQYLYGGTIEIDIFGNKKEICFDSMINKLPTHTIENYGMPYDIITRNNSSDIELVDESSNLYLNNQDNEINNDNIKRGNVFLIYEIKSLDEMKHHIIKLSKKYDSVATLVK